MHSTTLFDNPLTNYREAFDGYGSLRRQITDISGIVDNYYDISRNIITYGTLKTVLDTYPDFRGDYLAYSDSGSTVKDAVKEDIHTMILQQNNSYIMGMVALSTVLITTFLLLRK